MKQIQAPQANQKAMDNLLDKMYISNVSRRLRELNQPNDIDRKRWIWELLQNAKDTIANNPNRSSIKARIIIDGDTVKFQHDGDPFTANARLGLLYKYSEDKENSESTGRFGTGFLTTHCLSKVVSIDSNMYGDEDKIIGFSVTMFRDGGTEKELLDGLKKMRDSEKYYEEPFEWTTFTYHVNTDSGKKAITLGKENFKENIAQVFLFCKELASIELIDNGEHTTIERISDYPISEELYMASFKIKFGESSKERTFIYKNKKVEDEALTKKYKANRSIRLQTACEVDDKKNIISTGEKPSLFCVFPLVGIESQIQMPVFVNSQDFEPDSERQSLLLSGVTEDEEKKIITEVGINQKILKMVPELFESIVAYISENNYNRTFNLANGLKSVKDHDKLDKKWYVDEIQNRLRSILIEHPLLVPYETQREGSNLRKLSDCLIVKETKQEYQDKLFSLLTSIYPERLVADNNEWAHILWKDDTIKLWGTEDICSDIETKGDMDSLFIQTRAVDDNATDEVENYKWHNDFVNFVSLKDERLLKDYAILPNMNGKFLKKDADGFKTCAGVTDTVLDLLATMGGDMRPFLLHREIKNIALEGEFNSNSYSAYANKLACLITEDQSLDTITKIKKLEPLFSITVSDAEKYDTVFIEKRRNVFQVTKDLFELKDIETVTENSLNKSAWDKTDVWLTTTFLNTIQTKKMLSALPTGLGADWLNKALISMGITLTQMDEFAVLPNQNGVFHKSKELYIDSGVPEVLKDNVFEKVGLNYRNILLDKNIEATHFGKTSAKDISTFSEDLSTQIQGMSRYSYPYTNYVYGYYRKYPIESLRDVSRLIIQLVPENQESDAYKTQFSLREMSAFFLGESCKRREGIISFTDSKLWSRCRKFVCKDIMELIESQSNLKTLSEHLKVAEEDVIPQLNVLYAFLDTTNIEHDKRCIYLNQEGSFVARNNLYKEGEKIDSKIKKIISLIATDDYSNYYKILIDPRCKTTINQQKTSSDAYKYIDDTLDKMYKIPENWDDAGFKEAAQLLIDEWGESNKNVFDTNHFPKVYPIRDSISMNVIWTRSDRQNLQSLKNGLTTDELAEFVERLPEMKDLNSRNKELEAANKELEAENERLKKVIEDMEAGRTVKIKETDDGLSKKKMFAAQLEAQKKLMEERPDWKFPENYGQCNEEGIPYHFSTVNIQNEEDKTTPIVLKSYKFRDTQFKINPEEWEWVVEQKAKLLVYTPINGELDIVEVPQDDLVMGQSKISITFNSENLDTEKYAERISQFAETLHYFKELHFDFDKFHVTGNARPVKNIYARRSGNQPQSSNEDI